MSQITINDVILKFKDSSFTGDQWEQVASWVLNGGGEAAAESARIALNKAVEAVNAAANANRDANRAESYAVGGTGTREGEDTDNAKYYCEQTRRISGGEFIVSINGEGADETGNFTLNAEKVGAIDAEEKGTAGGVAELDATGKVPTGQLPDTMTPAAHADTHKQGGSDPLILTDIGAAPAGYGYGGQVINLGMVTESELETKLTELLGTMQTLEAKQFCANGFVYSDWRFFGTLYKSSANYASCLMQSPYAYGSIVQKVYYAGDGWLPYEWVNPRMELDGEYRTAERYNGKPVYAMWVNFGALANSAEKGLSVAKLANTTVISIHGYAHGNDGTYDMALPGYKGIASMGVTRGAGRLWITTNMDMSAYKAYVYVKYVKN